MPARDPRERDGEPPALLPGRARRRFARQPLHRRPQRRPRSHRGDRRGHERVIRARLSDAAFFYREDLAKPIEAFVAQLDTIVFQDRLGSLGDKVAPHRAARRHRRRARRRVRRRDRLRRACRAPRQGRPRVNAVVEFTDLQGVMGGYYALAAGEEPGVAEAIVDHYRPRFAGDELPRSLAGRIVAIADKLDTIAGIFAAGMAPTGSADPYALAPERHRRAADAAGGPSRDPRRADRGIALRIRGRSRRSTAEATGTADQGVLRRAASEDPARPRARL